MDYVPTEGVAPSDVEFKESALGCIFGTFVGDSCGSFLEFEKEISEEQMVKCMTMPGGGPHNVGAG